MFTALRTMRLTQTILAQPSASSLAAKASECGHRALRSHEIRRRRQDERVTKINIAGNLSSRNVDLIQMLAISASSGLALGLLNYSFERYADENPDSIFAHDVEDGVGWRIANYVVPVSVTASGSALWFATQCTIFGRCSSWWFGSQPHWVTTLLCSLTVGHYMQEVFVNKWSGQALFAHHCGAIAHAFCLLHANAWRGLLLCWSALYEVGSVLLNFGYIGFIPEYLGHLSAAATTTVGMGLGLQSLSRHRPSFGFNAPARFCVMALLCIGAGRIQVAHKHLSKSS